VARHVPRRSQNFSGDAAERHPLARLLCGALSLAGALTLVGCEPAPVPDVSSASERIDLTRFGVHEIVAGAGGYDLLDADGQEVGRVALRDAVHGDPAKAELFIRLQDHAAEVNWDAAVASARCDGGEPWTVRSGPDGWTTPLQDAGDSLEDCDGALLVGFEVARAAGLEPPWTSARTP
jgi:hypothetical protein